MEKKFYKKTIFWIGIIVAFAIIDVCLGEIYSDFFNGFYESWRLITANHQFGDPDDTFHLNIFVRFIRLPLLAVFVYFTYRLFFNILFPKFIDQLKIKCCFKDHYVIFGNDEIHIELIRKINPRITKQQVVLIVLPKENKSNLQDFQGKYFKIIEGDPLFGMKKGSNIFDTVNLEKASKFFVVTKDDNINIEIARNAWSYLSDLKNPQKNKKAKIKSVLKQNETALRCYTLVTNRELKNILEETPIFKYERKENEIFYFDGVAFNLDSIGIQYGINTNIQNILPDFSQKQPVIFIDGLNESAISIIQNLSHIITKTNEKLMFHINETDEEKNQKFDTQYAFLKDFADFVFCFEPEIYDYSSIFVCTENPTEAINKAVEIRYRLKKNKPTIFLVTSRCDYVDSVFNVKGHTETKIITFGQKSLNIKPFNRVKYFWNLVVENKEKRKEIEDNAIKIHEEYASANPIDKYEYLTETYKQSNRNAALDYDIKLYLVNNKITDDNIEYLAEIEHRRWMLEKYADGWRMGKTRDDTYKINPLLKHWDKLKDTDEPEKKYNKNFSEKANDRNSIKLMQRIFNEKHQKNENVQPTTA